MDFELIKANYLQLRRALIKYLEKFDEESYFYQPTEKSNAVAWIVPHIAAFEKVMVVDKIAGYDFNEFIIPEDVEKYKPSVAGYAYTKNQMMSMEEAIALLKKTMEVSSAFLDEIVHDSEKVKDVDKAVVFDKYMFNFSHETEHYGQIKYLLGTYKRTH
jgi:hypothetical protein